MHSFVGMRLHDGRMPPALNMRVAHYHDVKKREKTRA